MKRAAKVATALAALVALAGCDLLGLSRGGGEEPNGVVGPTIDAAELSEALSPAALEGTLAAVGPNNAWTVSVDPALGVTFRDGQTFMEVTGAYAAPVSQGGGVFIGDPALGLQITAGPCSSGVAGVVYPFSVTVSRDGAEAVSGCLYRPWTNQIVANADQVLSCLRLSPGRSAATYIERRADEVFVRVMGEPAVEGAPGAMIDCRAPVTASPAQLITAPADASVYPGEAVALFYPAPGDNPGGECYVAPEVKNAAGQVIGWLASPEGC